MIRIYNVDHIGVGKPVQAVDMILFHIPPIGSYVEIDPIHANKVQDVIDNSLGHFSLTEPNSVVNQRVDSLVNQLQDQLAATAEQNAALLARLAELEAKVSAVNVESENPDAPVASKTSRKKSEE